MHRLATLGAVVLCAGCFLLVENAPNGDQFTSTCTVATSTACGTCIDNSCGTELTACCADTACRGVLPSIDQCADAGGCVIDTSSQAASALEGCIAQHCSACHVAPLTVYDAGVFCTSDPALAYCQCSTDSILGSTSTRCDTTTLPNSMCCADQGWPSSGSCTCAPMACTPTSGGCMCIWDNGASTTQACDQSFGFCCMSSNDCSCTGTACDSFSSPTADCTTPAAAYCHTGQHMVSNCSAF